MDEREEQLLQEVGARIAQARKQRKISQNKLAETVGISAAHLSAIELGKTKFSILIFSRIAETLQVSADTLLCLNTPALAQVNASVVDELFHDCTAEETQAMLHLMREAKTALRAVAHSGKSQRKNG